jgi:transcription termination factor Rho
MFHGQYDASYRVSQLQQEHLEAAVRNFNLTLIQPGILDDIEDDMIFIRGNIEVENAREEKSAVSPTRVKRQMTKDEPQLS